MRNIIIGAGGHARSLIPLVIQNLGLDTCVADENFSVKEEIYPGIFLDRQVPIETINKNIILAIGDSLKRKSLYERFNVYKPNLVHELSFIEESAILGESNQIFGNVIINSLAKINDNNIINTGSILEHEVEVGSHNHISVGANICGRVKIGDNCFIGAGSTIIDGIKVCDDVIIGANSVVIKDITEPGTYIGNPTRKIK
ncbi:MAG: acetyltransferase [Halobacteriovoraceae bacterium]|nr:acetyltransferase [Halobacteriovoraceae bacterium]